MNNKKNFWLYLSRYSFFKIADFTIFHFVFFNERNMKPGKFNSIKTSIFGEKELTDPERYFMTFISFTSAIFLVVMVIFHMIIHLKIAPAILAGSFSLILFTIYYLVRFTNQLLIPKLIMIIAGLIFLDLVWYFRFLSNGPVLYFIFLLAAFILWIMQGRLLTYLLTLILINPIVLFFIEYNTPASQILYPHESMRIYDIYLSYILYTILMIIVLLMIKKEFINQREGAIRSDKLKSAFLANMSHEIRTPMNTMIGFSELSATETDMVKREQYLNIIKHSGRNLLVLINDIIDLSKIEAGDLRLKYSDFGLASLFFELKEIYSVELVKREKLNVKIEYKLPKEDIVLHSDPARLKQVLANLLSNSIKFTSEGTISLSCEKVGHELIFTISDTGTGIPEDDQKHIFERFTKYNYRGLNTEGSGIGLSIVQKIVELLQGKIWLESTMNVGSTFHFSIPYIPPVLNTELYKKTHKMNLVENLSDRKQVLVVEDDKNSLFLIREILGKIDIEIHHVSDGRDAINFILDHPDTHLILMDIKLSQMDGYEATSEIKKINKNIPIIAQTAFAMLGDKEKALEAGCDDYLTKPLDAKTLQEMVKYYLSN